MIIMDIKKLKEYNLTIDEFLILNNIYQNIKLENVDNELLNKLEKLNLIKLGKNIILRQKGIDIVKLLAYNIVIPKKKNNTLSSREINNIVEENAHILRNKWKGLKPGSMGSLNALKTKLKRWMSTNTNYTFNDILKAADIYIKSLNNDYRYLQQADYFVYKKIGKEEHSRLDSFIDEPLIDNSDWTTKLK